MQSAVGTFLSTAGAVAGPFLQQLYRPTALELAAVLAVVAVVGCCCFCCGLGWGLWIAGTFKAPVLRTFGRALGSAATVLATEARHRLAGYQVS